MPAGYWFMFFGLLSFAAMGIIHKLGDRFACNPLHIALFTMATSCVLSFFNAALSQRESLISLNARVMLIALPFMGDVLQGHMTRIAARIMGG